MKLSKEGPGFTYSLRVKRIKEYPYTIIAVLKSRIRSPLSTSQHDGFSNRRTSLCHSAPSRSLRDPCQRMNQLSWAARATPELESLSQYPRLRSGHVTRARHFTPPRGAEGHVGARLRPVAQSAAWRGWRSPRKWLSSADSCL